jgi:hypothetical protein
MRDQLLPACCDSRRDPSWSTHLKQAGPRRASVVIAAAQHCESDTIYSCPAQIAIQPIMVINPESKGIYGWKGNGDAAQHMRL